MRALLDTHTWLWWLTGPEQIGEAARTLIADPHHEVLFSIASTWEITIKHSVGKLILPDTPARLIPRELQHDSITTLHIEHRHALKISELPHHHRDPFDRLLIAQALCEDVPVLTCDPHFARYGVDIVWS